MAVTKGMLDDAVAKISAMVAKIDEKIDTKIDAAIGSFAIMVEKGFQGMAKQMDSRFEQVDRRFEKIDAQFKKVDDQFDKVFSELKETRKEIGVNELKTRGDVAGLDFRVGKLEKKVGL